jgi:cbb3-type cytochrome c oxidase subunit III
MNRGMSLMGLGGTLLILAALGMAIIREPTRQVEAAEAIRATQALEGIALYAEYCATCHGANGEGSALAPALNVDALRERLSDTDITRIISQGVSGTLMAAWNRALLPEQITDLTGLIRSWDMLEVAGITLPVIESDPVDMSPEAIATGQRLYGLVCAQCHGTNGFGIPLAPALNSQGFLSQTPDEALQQIIARGVPGTAMPSWGGYLTEADIAAITAYLRSLEPTAPAVAALR